MKTFNYLHEVKRLIVFDLLLQDIFHFYKSGLKNAQMRHDEFLKLIDHAHFYLEHYVTIKNKSFLLINIYLTER